MKVTTQILQAHHAIWVKDLTIESLLALDLKLRRGDAAFKQALAAAEIELALCKASVSNLASIGHFSMPERTVEKVDWSFQGNINSLEQDDWLTLLMVDADYQTLRKIALAGGGRVPRS